MRRRVTIAASEDWAAARDYNRRRIRAAVAPTAAARTRPAPTGARRDPGLTDAERRSLRAQVRDVKAGAAAVEALAWCSWAYERSYTTVAERDVPAERHRVAMTATVLAAGDLRVDVPELRWFTGDTNLHGFAPTGEDLVLLNAALPPPQLVATAAHEVAHVAGQHHPDADEYARRFAARYTDRILHG